VALVGYFGSYARGDWGVGSDLDMVIVVEESTQPFERRAIEWDLTSLPVPADVMVYTLAEWQSSRSQSKFFQMLQEETVWVYPP
jgi:predicted nucleotidyltransferase